MYESFQWFLVAVDYESSRSTLDKCGIWVKRLMYHKIWLSSRIKTVLSAICLFLMSNSALSFVEFGKTYREFEC